jgi:[ribosomal protein S5]-alanine N-acetyltransferase
VLRIVTERLLLRDYMDEDLDALYRQYVRAEVTEFLIWSPSTQADIREFLDRAAQGMTQKPRQLFELAVTLKSTGALIGGGALHASGTNAELGYFLGPDYWGQGYAVELAHALLAYGFRTLGVHRVYATCRPANLRSAAVLGKIGMRQEGHMREHVRSKGQYQDSLLFAILEEEYRKKGN